MGNLGLIRRRASPFSRRRSSIRRPSVSIRRPSVSIRRPSTFRKVVTSRPVQKMPMFKPTMNQRKPLVSLVARKPKVIARTRIASVSRRPSIFSQKPFRITRPSSRYYRTTRRPSILMKYNRPSVDYSSRYRNERAKNRSLTVALSKEKASAKLAEAEHKKIGKGWQEEKDRYGRSPGYVYDKFADHMNKRYVNATKVISPGLDGIGGLEENLSWTGAGLLGLLFVGLIIGRVE